MPPFKQNLHGQSDGCLLFDSSSNINIKRGANAGSNKSSSNVNRFPPPPPPRRHSHSVVSTNNHNDLRPTHRPDKTQARLQRSDSRGGNGRRMTQGIPESSSRHKSNSQGNFGSANNNRSKNNNDPQRRRRPRKQKQEGMEKERKPPAATAAEESNSGGEAADKYRQVYETMLNELQKDDNDSAWVGLGYCGNLKECSRPRSSSTTRKPCAVDKKSLTQVPSGSQTNRRNSSRSKGRGRSRSTGSSRIYGVKDSKMEGHEEKVSESGKNKKGIFRNVKKIAGKVKTKYLHAGIHKYKSGERARFKLDEIPMSLAAHVDPESWTVEVEIVKEHIDVAMAMEMPFYSIKLPDGSLCQTNWDQLVPLLECRHQPKANSCKGNDNSESCTRQRSSSQGRGVAGQIKQSLSRSGSRQRPRSLSRGDKADGSTLSDWRPRPKSSLKYRGDRSGSKGPCSRRHPQTLVPYQLKFNPITKNDSTKLKSRKEGRTPSEITKSPSCSDSDTCHPPKHVGRHQPQGGIARFRDNELISFLRIPPSPVPPPRVSRGSSLAQPGTRNSLGHSGKQNDRDHLLWAYHERSSRSLTKSSFLSTREHRGATSHTRG